MSSLYPRALSSNKSYIHNNNVTFIGTTDGEKIISNGVYIFDTKPTVRENNFTLVIPAADITYGPAPRYEETIIAEGIVIDYVDDLQFTENNVTVSYGDIVGYYDTIRAIDISNSNRAIVAENKINAKGNTYMYAIKLTGKDFDIQYNQINSTSNYYANAINIESPSNGFITDNIIGAIAPNSAYPIYAGMNGQNLSMLIEDNYIYGEAYYVVGVEVGGDNVSIKYNDIDVIGNHTIGIGAYVNNLEVEDNTINSIASNEGDLPIWDNFGTDSAGIIVKKGNFTIEDNDIETTGEYAAVLGDNNGTVAYNDLLSNQGAGNEAIIGLGNVNATENPETKNKHVKIVLVADAFTKVYGSGDLFVVKILDENGQAVGNKTIKVLVAGQTFTEVSDADGIASFNINVNPEEYLAMIKFDGDADYGYKSLMKSFTITKKPFTAPDKSLLVTATKSGVNYNIVLKDKSGNALAGKKVTITFNGKTSTATTNAKGEITYKIVVAKAGSYKLTLKFDGDDLCDAATATATIKVTKEATKLTANKKTFKAKAKTKKYTVTLKDSKGKAIKKVKLTLKIKNKTFKAKTNAKGKAIFKIKKLTKKGKYTAKVTFAGNNLYNKVAKSVKITLK